MSFWRRISPRGAIADFVEEWRQPTPYRWQILGVSVAATFAMMMLFMPETERAPPPKPVVTWIRTFAPDRTEAEIVASNLENQKRQDAIKAEEQRRVELRRDFYRALGRASGFDVDKLEKEFSDEPSSAPPPPVSIPTASARPTGEQ